MGYFFMKNIFTPLVYIPNDQRVMGIILRLYVGVPTDPLPRGARRLTAQPADPLGLGQRAPPPPPSPTTTTPKMIAHPSGSHIGCHRPPCVNHYTENKKGSIERLFGAHLITISPIGVVQLRGHLLACSKNATYRNLPFRGFVLHITLV